MRVKDCENCKYKKNLTKLGYQKIVWRNAKKDMPERLKYVLGYNVRLQTFAIVSWSGTDFWFDNNMMC